MTAFVGDVDFFEARDCDASGAGKAIEGNRPTICLDLAVVLVRQEPFGHEEIGLGAEIGVAGGQRPALFFGGAFVPASSTVIRLPFLDPEIVVAAAAPQLAAGPVDIAEIGLAPRRKPDGDNVMIGDDK